MWLPTAVVSGSLNDCLGVKNSLDNTSVWAIGLESSIDQVLLNCV